MKKIIAIIIGIVIIVGVLSFVVLSDDGFFEESTEFGSWGQQMVFEYRDGSKSNNILSFLHDDQPVNKVFYTLKASASATTESDFTQVEIDTSNLELGYGVQNEQIGKEKIHTKNFDDNFLVPVTGELHTIISDEFYTSLIPDSVANDDYVFFIKLDGELRYRGKSIMGDGEWKHCVLPEPLTAGISIGPAGDVSVDLDQDTDYEYGEEETPDSWEWELGDGCTEITFTQEQLESAQLAYGPSHESWLVDYHPEVVFHTCGSPAMLLKLDPYDSSSEAVYDFQYMTPRFSDKDISVQSGTTYYICMSGNVAPRTLIIPK